jgi:hypothetical protein
VRGLAREVIRHVVRDRLAMLPQQAVLLGSRHVGDPAQRIGGLVVGGLVIGATAWAGQLSDGRTSQFGHHF